MWNQKIALPSNKKYVTSKETMQKWVSTNNFMAAKLENSAVFQAGLSNYYGEHDHQASILGVSTPLFQSHTRGDLEANLDAAMR